MTALWPALNSARAELGLRPLVAAQESSEHRRARVRLQLRDRHGKWIEMGGGVRWKVNGKYLHGVVDGLGPALGDVPTVRVKTSAGTEVNVRHTDLETMKASLNAPAPGRTDGFVKAEIKPEASNRVLDYADAVKAPDLKNGDVVHQTTELATGDLVTTGELYRVDGVQKLDHAGPYPRYAVTSTNLQSGKQYTNEVDDLQRYWKAKDSDVRLDASAPGEEFNPNHDDTKFDEVINTDGSKNKLDKNAAGAPVDSSKTGVEATLDEKQKGISDSLGNDKHGNEMRVGTEIKYPKKGAGLVTGTIESGAYDSPWLKVKRSNGVFDSVHKDNVTVQKKADAPQVSPVSAKQTWFKNQPHLDPMHLEIKDPAVAEEWNNGDKFKGMSPVDKYAVDNITTYEVGAGYRRMVPGEQYKNWHGNGPAMETAVLLDAKSSGDGTYDPHNPQTGWGVFRFDDGREEIEFLSNFKGTKKYDRVAPNKESQNDNANTPSLGPGVHAPGQEEAPQPGVPGQTDVEGGGPGDHQGGSHEEAHPADEVTYGPLHATEEEQRALAEYAALAQSKALGAYNVVNTELRKGDESHPFVALLDSAIEKAPPLEQETTVYRYVKSFTGQAVPSSTDASSTYYSVIPGKMEPGTVLRDRGYMSTTRENLIDSPGPGTGTVYFRIKLPAGTKAVDVTAQDLNASHPEYQYAGKDEQELLLGRGKYLRVVSDTGFPSIGSGQKRVVDVEVISADQINHEEAQSADIENIRAPLLRSRETVLKRVNDEVTAVAAGKMADTAVLRKNHEMWRSHLEQLNKELEQLGDERVDPLPPPVGPESPDYVPLPANKLTHEVAGSTKYSQAPLYYGQVVFDGGTHKVVIVGDSSSGHMQSNVLVQELHSGKFNPYWVDRQMLRDGKKDGLDLQSLDDTTKEITPTVDAVLDPANFENDFQELIDSLIEAGYSENDSHESVSNLYDDFVSGEIDGRQTADRLEKLIFDDYASEGLQADLVGKLRAALNNPTADQKKADLPESDVQAETSSAGSFTQLAGGPIPPDVLASLDGYALSDYTEINAAIRLGDPSLLNDVLFGNSEVPNEPGETTTVGKAIENIKSIMARSTLKNDLTLYRGINDFYDGFNAVEVGDRLKEKAFTSTTRSEITAENFHDGSGVLFVINAPKGANAIDVSHLFPNSLIAEQEILLPTDSQFDVTHIEQKGGLKVVHVDLVHGEEELPATSSPFSVLSDRGQSGDGYAAPGLWGKYGAAGVLIRHVDDSGDEKFLLVQRGPGVSSNQGKWQLPGGALDEHETPHQAAARETVEELGADPEMLSRMTSAGETVFEHPSGWKYTNIAADAPEQFTPQVDGTETSAAKWVNRNELDDMRANGDLVSAFANTIGDILAHFDTPSADHQSVVANDKVAAELSDPVTKADSAAVGELNPSGIDGVGISSFKWLSDGGDTTGYDDYHRDGLTAEENSALNWYINATWAEELNTSLRHENTAEFEKFNPDAISHLDSAISKSTLNRPALVHRVLATNDLTDQLKVGEVFRDRGYMSTANNLDRVRSWLDEQIADNPYPDDSPATWPLLHITLPEGSHGTVAHPELDPDTPNQVEWVLPRNSGLRIDNVNADGSYNATYVFPEQASSAPLEVPDDTSEPDFSNVEPLHVSTADWKKIGGKLGSNPGGTYESPDGKRYYVKIGETPSHVKNEVLATQFYREAGVDIPNVIEVQHEGKSSVASELIPGAKPDLTAHLNDQQYVDRLREGFVVDAWLANWDVAGLVHDNVVTNSDGNPVRVDTGGALLWRAQGKPKGDAFGTEVKELDTLRDPYTSTAADFFSGMTNQQLMDSGERVRAITPERIDALVNSVHLDPVESAHLAQTLKARREFILDKLGIPDTPSNSDEGSAPVETMAPAFNPDDWNSLPDWEKELLHGSKMDPSYDPAPNAPAPTNLDPPISGTTVDEVQVAADKLVASLGLSADGKTKIEVGHKVTTNKGESGTVVKDNVNPNYFFVKFDTGPKAGKTLARSTKTLTVVNAPSNESTSAPAPASDIPSDWTPADISNVPGAPATYTDANGYKMLTWLSGTTSVHTPDGTYLGVKPSRAAADELAKSHAAAGPPKAVAQKQTIEEASVPAESGVPEGWMQTAPPSVSGTRYFKDVHGNNHVIYDDGTVYSYDSNDKTIGAFDNAAQAKNKADALANTPVVTDQYGLNPAPYVPQGRINQESHDYTDNPQDLLSKEGADHLEELFQEALDGNHKSIMIKFDYEEYVPTEAVRDALVLAGRIQPPHVAEKSSTSMPDGWSLSGPVADSGTQFFLDSYGNFHTVYTDGTVRTEDSSGEFVGNYDSPAEAAAAMKNLNESQSDAISPAGTKPSLGTTKGGDQLYPGSKVQYIKKDFGKIGGTVVSRSAYNDKMIVIKPDNFSGTHTTHVDNIELDRTKTQSIPGAPTAPAAPAPTGPSWIAAGGKQIWVGTEVKDAKGQTGRVVSGTTSPEYVKVRITSGPQTGKIVARSRTKLTPTGGVGHGQNTPTLPPGADPALVGKPRPQPPAPPSLTSTPHVSDEWMASAKAHYDTLLKGKPLEQSNTWPRFVRVRDEGSQVDLDHLHNIGYITDQQHADGTAQLTKQKEANDQILITHGQAMKKYQEDLKAWALANGNTLDGFDASTFVPKGMTGAKQFGSHWDGDEYSKDHWLTASKYPSEARAAVKKYVQSSSTANPPLWNLAETSRVSLGSLDSYTRKHIQDLDQAMDFATRVPEDMILVRGTDSAQFGLSYSADPTSLIGQVKTNFGFTSASASDHPGLSNSYEMRIRVPKGYKAIGIAGNNFGTHNEAEVLLPRDTSFYIHSVTPGAYGNGWIIDAEVVPPGWEPENHLASKQSGLNY